MAEFFGELVIELIKFVVQSAFDPCHTQRGCILSLLTFVSFAGTIAIFIAAFVLTEGAAAGVCLAVAALCGMLFITCGAVMIWSKSVDRP